MLAAASSIHEPEESRSCRTDSRSESHGDKEDKKPAERKTSEPSHCQEGQREVLGLVDPDLPGHTDLPQGQGHSSSQRRSRKHSPKHIGRIGVTVKGQGHTLGHCQWQGQTQGQCRGQGHSQNGRSQSPEDQRKDHQGQDLRSTSRSGQIRVNFKVQKVKTESDLKKIRF